MKPEPIRAFPHKPEVRQQISHDLECVTPGDQPGMTLRDYFAAKAMQGYMAWQMTPEEHEPGKPITPAQIAQRAFQYADAMLAARGGEATEESEK